MTNCPSVPIRCFWGCSAPALVFRLPHSAAGASTRRKDPKKEVNKNADRKYQD
nr:MAG TPA: hypothetical protein [Caudoviricetes sp.]